MTAATITVPDGYNGHTVILDATLVLAVDGDLRKLAVVGRPWSIRWVSVRDYPEILRGESAK